MEQYLAILESVRKVSNGAAHGFDHILAVYSNAQNMIKSSVAKLSEAQKHIILLAAILHDVDDHKFNSAADSENLTVARSLLVEHGYENVIAPVLFCIGLVSYSKNQHRIPTEIPDEIDRLSPDKKWILIPQHSDRIEAIDLLRAIEFGDSKNRPRYNSKTRYYLNVAEIEHDIATGVFKQMEKEYIARGCRSHPDADTSMDHIYEKCMNLAVETGNPWCNAEMQKRQNQLNAEIVEFWRNEPVVGGIIDIKNRQKQLCTEITEIPKTESGTFSVKIADIKKRIDAVDIEIDRTVSAFGST